MACPDIPNTPKMVAVKSPDGKSYCIDSTEVTNAHYKAWTLKSPSIAGQPLECTWNMTYLPPGNLGEPDLPVVNIDWCDAYAFCKTNEKRLCGHIDGGPNGYEDEDVAAKSQWFNACSAGGAKAFPYGDAYNMKICNGKDNGVGVPVPVTSMLGCVGGYPGLHDMSGNVWEWEDSCDGATGSSDLCRRRGGMYSSSEAVLDCSTKDQQPRSTGANGIGFRCCQGP
jgi:formylglycine-generating enzyme required for sulfatase activity